VFFEFQRQCLALSENEVFLADLFSKAFLRSLKLDRLFRSHTQRTPLAMIKIPLLRSPLLALICPWAGWSMA